MSSDLLISSAAYTVVCSDLVFFMAGCSGRTSNDAKRLPLRNPVWNWGKNSVSRPIRTFLIPGTNILICATSGDFLAYFFLSSYLHSVQKLGIHLCLRVMDSNSHTCDAKRIQLPCIVNAFPMLSTPMALLNWYLFIISGIWRVLLESVCCCLGPSIPCINLRWEYQRKHWEGLQCYYIMSVTLLLWVHRVKQVHVSNNDFFAIGPSASSSYLHHVLCYCLFLQVEVSSRCGSRCFAYIGAVKIAYSILTRISSPFSSTYRDILRTSSPSRASAPSIPLEKIPPFWQSRF